MVAMATFSFLWLYLAKSQACVYRMQKILKCFQQKNTSVLVIFNSLFSSASTKHLINDKLPKQLHNTKLLLLHIS